MRVLCGPWEFKHSAIRPRDSVIDVAAAAIARRHPVLVNAGRPEERGRKGPKRTRTLIIRKPCIIKQHIPGINEHPFIMKQHPFMIKGNPFVIHVIIDENPKQISRTCVISISNQSAYMRNQWARVHHQSKAFLNQSAPINQHRLISSQNHYIIDAPSHKQANSGYCQWTSLHLSIKIRPPSRGNSLKIRALS